jgi:hypothetical protein
MPNKKISELSEWNQSLPHDSYILALPTGQTEAQKIKLFNTNSYGSFTVGGSSSSYYPVIFRLVSPTYGCIQQKFRLFRDGYYDGGVNGGFSLTLSFTATNYGNILSKICDVKYFINSLNSALYDNPVADIADGTTNYINNPAYVNELIIWLKGGGNYKWQSPEAGSSWLLANGNAAGSSITSATGTLFNSRNDQEPWVLACSNVGYTPTLLNSFVNYGGSYKPLKIFSDGINVKIEGLIARASIPAANTIIFNLPNKIQPSGGIIYNSIASINSVSNIIRYDLTNTTCTYLTSLNSATGVLDYLPININYNNY